MSKVVEKVFDLPAGANTITDPLFKNDLLDVAVEGIDQNIVFGFLFGREVRQNKLLNRLSFDPTSTEDRKVYTLIKMIQ